MTCHLPASFLKEVFEHLEEDKITLHSCLLVNHLWYEISVRVLWRDIWSFKSSTQEKVKIAIIRTLLSCLSNESKEFLRNEKIYISTPTSNPPLFNYAACCNTLSINEIAKIINEIPRYENFTCLVTNEILKMFMDQITSLKKLTYYTNYYDIPFKISLIHFPGARDCLENLSELHCNSNIHSKFFYQLSRICHDIQSLTIEIGNGSVGFSNELKELISLQNNLKDLNFLAYKGSSWADIIPSLTKHRNTLTKLQIYSDGCNLPLSFVSLFSNLQEINFSFIEVGFNSYLEDFKELQNSYFPNLQILKFPFLCPESEYVIKFLEVNGKNLKELCLNSYLGLSIAKFCPNLKRLFVLFKNDDLDVLKTIFNSCQYLESIKIWCGDGILNKKKVLKVVANHSPKDFYELRICNSSEWYSEDLESFFISWKNREPKKSLSLIIIKLNFYQSLEENEDNMKIIEKYISLGVIKKFETKWFQDEEEDEKYIWDYKYLRPMPMDLISSCIKNQPFVIT